MAATSPLASSVTTGNVNTAGAVVEAVVLAVDEVAGSLLLFPQETTNNTQSPTMMIRRVITQELMRQIRCTNICPIWAARSRNAKQRASPSRSVTSQLPAKPGFSLVAAVLINATVTRTQPKDEEPGNGELIEQSSGCDEDFIERCILNTLKFIAPDSPDIAGEAVGDPRYFINPYNWEVVAAQIDGNAVTLDVFKPID